MNDLGAVHQRTAKRHDAQRRGMVAPPGTRRGRHSFLPCLRKACSHDRAKHRQAWDSDNRRPMYGICLVEGCMCHEYAEEPRIEAAYRRY